MDFKEQNILNNIFQEFQNIQDVKAIAIGGSGANKTSDTLSDIDVYFFIEKDIPVSKREACRAQFFAP